MPVDSWSCIDQSKGDRRLSVTANIYDGESSWDNAEIRQRPGVVSEKKGM